MELKEAYEQFITAGIIDNINYTQFNAFLLTHHSTRIEGSTLTELDTRLLLEQGITPKGKPLEHSNMVKDHYDALLFVLGAAQRKEQISESFIQEIGSRVNKTTGKRTNTALGTFDDSKGDYRLANAFAGNDYFLGFAKIPEHMRKLCDEINAKLPGISGVEEVYRFSFAVHFYLVEIHPFGDGNGRTARLLMNYVQAYHRLPLTPVFSEDKKDYILALKASRKEGNPAAIEEFLSGQAVKYFEHELKARRDMKQGLSFLF